jgi:hypothetical protein
MMQTRLASHQVNTLATTSDRQRGDLQTGRKAAGACLQLGRKKVELNAVVAHVEGNFPAGLVTPRHTTHQVSKRRQSVSSQSPCR